MTNVTAPETPESQLDRPIANFNICKKLLILSL